MKITIEVELSDTETQPYNNWKKTREILSVKVNGKEIEETDPGEMIESVASQWEIHKDDIHTLDLVLA